MTSFDTTSVRRHIPADVRTFPVDGGDVHLVDEQTALSLITTAGATRGDRPLAVVSINLDHIHHFGDSRRASRDQPAWQPSSDVEWLNLIDGAPIVMQARRATGQTYPKLSGSDLIESVLADADRRGLSVAVVGGSPEVTESLLRRFADDWPRIRFAGHWTPEREELADPRSAQAVADEIRAAKADIVMVCLGKPRQEEWIGRHGASTGAGSLLAFGAVVDFLAGRVSRAPGWVSRSGFEWAWRLAREPRRLFRRYVIQGPMAYIALLASPAADISRLF